MKHFCFYFCNHGLHEQVEFFLQSSVDAILVISILNFTLWKVIGVTCNVFSQYFALLMLCCTQLHFNLALLWELGTLDSVVQIIRED